MNQVTINEIMTEVVSMAERYATQSDGHFDLQAYVAYLAGINAGMQYEKQLQVNAELLAKEVQND